MANGNGTGISADAGSVVVHNVAARNSLTGIAAVGNSSTISGNTASANNGDGINAFRGNVLHNTANEKGGVGLLVFCPGNVMGNLSTDNTGTNIQVDATGGVCTVDGNHNNTTIPNF